MATADELTNLAGLLDRDDVFDFVADAITESRNRAPRVIDPATDEPLDRDSGDLLTDLIEALRGTS